MMKRAVAGCIRAFVRAGFAPRRASMPGRTLYIGHVSSRTRERDLDDLFNRYGRVIRTEVKRNFAFVEFADDRDAADAVRALNGYELDGSRLLVEVAHGGARQAGAVIGGCFICGRDGHWARECPDATDRDRNRCFNCGSTSHLARDCRERRNDPRGRRSRSRSRSPRRRSPSPRRRSTSRDRERDRGRDRSRSRSRERGRESRRSLSPRRRDRSASPARKAAPTGPAEGAAPAAAAPRDASPSPRRRSPARSRSRSRSRS